MDWSYKNWRNEDQLYFPKRKVNNRGSQYYPHIIGGFFSIKNQVAVEYESLSERLFYYYLELDRAVSRYYVQPVEIPVNSGEGKWYHTPDVLAFRHGYRPLLYQVKLEEVTSKKFVQTNQACENYAFNMGWEYHIIYPSTLPAPIQRNIKFLKGFLRVREYYPDMYKFVVNRVRILEAASINFVAESLSDRLDPLYIKPLIFHLIAKGIFHVSINEIITGESQISLQSEFDTMITLITGEERHDL
jgi:hypothetical protein